MATYTASSSGCTTWTTWNASYDSTSSASTASSAWYSWNSGYCTAVATTASSGTGETWTWWNTPTTIEATCSPKPAELTLEMIEEAKRIADEQALRAEEFAREYRAKEKAKEEKARQLLREVLSDEQDKQLEDNGYFELTSVKSGNRYRINKGRTKNVELLDKGGVAIKRLCFHPDSFVHNYDTMVAQKLMLESDEEEVKKVANYS